MSEGNIHLRLFYSTGSVVTLVISPNGRSKKLLEEIRHELSTKDSPRPLFLVQIRHPITHFWVDVGESSLPGVAFSAIVEALHPSYPHQDCSQQIIALIDAHEAAMWNPPPTRGFHFIAGLHGHS